MVIVVSRSVTALQRVDDLAAWLLVLEFVGVAAVVARLRGARETAFRRDTHARISNLADNDGRALQATLAREIATLEGRIAELRALDRRISQGHGGNVEVLAELEKFRLETKEESRRSSRRDIVFLVLGTVAGIVGPLVLGLVLP
jgi:hypothetical protein